MMYNSVIRIARYIKHLDLRKYGFEIDSNEYLANLNTSDQAVVDVLRDMNADIVAFQEMETFTRGHFNTRNLQLEFLFNIPKIRFRQSEEFVKYCIVGFSGLFVNLGLYICLTRLFTIDMTVSSPIAIELSIISNFILNINIFDHILS